jgi:hypothetical protein
MKPTQYLDESRMRQIIKDKIRVEHWKQEKLAEMFGCSTNLISLMLNEKRSLNKEILSFAGYEKIISYRKQDVHEQ